MDGIKNNVNEQCDNGPSSASTSSNSSKDGCSNYQINCGNGVVDTTEECDDGNPAVDVGGCSAAFQNQS